MFHWFDRREDFEAFVSNLLPMRAAVESYLEKQDDHVGYCVACNEVGRFLMPRPLDGSWRDLRESFLCKCSLNGRMRMVYSHLRTLLLRPEAPSTVLLERVTPLFERISAQFPFVQGSEFVAGDQPSGSIHNVNSIQVRHESMLALSYSSNSLDVLFHGDVLEHVPDHYQGLRECYRVLRTRGKLVFTCPFFNLERHVVRCSLKDGRLVHHLAEAYHGNPVSEKGSLVFVHHGWPLLDDLRAAGFARVRLGLLYDPFQGIVSNNNHFSDGHMWPVLFEAEK